MWVNNQPVKVSSFEFGQTKTIGQLMHKFIATLYHQVNNLAKDVINPHDYPDDIPLMCQLDWLGYEDVRPINKVHMQQHFGMTAMLHYEFAYVPTCLYGVTSPSVKKELTGNGRASKQEMLDVATSEPYLNLQVKNHDEADALGVGLVIVNRLLK